LFCKYLLGGETAAPSGLYARLCHAFLVFFHSCLFEIAETVRHIFNLSFDCGAVSKHWLSSVVTPVSKVAKPESLSDYMYISVIPLLSRLEEKLVV